jgi:hypothetical protein
MNFDFSQIAPFAIALLAVFLIYRRFRRNFGQQLLRPIRMQVRIVLLLLIGCLLLPIAFSSAKFLAALCSGVAAGGALAAWGAARTRFVRVADKLYYVPHTYTGIAVSFLFLGRLVYRVAQSYGGMQANPALAAGASHSVFGSDSMVRSPLTLGLFFVLMGYYVCYYSAVLWKSKQVKAEEAGPGIPLRAEPEKRA